MKKVVFILFVVLTACNSEDANDCFQKAGPIIQQAIEVGSFNRIIVYRDIELILKEAPEHSVTIVTGRNLINDVQAVVVGNELQLKNNNTCNYVREYGLTKIYVTAPNITEIRSSTQFDIISDGVLNYDELLLTSEDSNFPGSFTVGDFRLDMNSTQLSIVSNNISSFYITGNVETLIVDFFSGAGRFEGASLIAQHVDIYHRGSNDMVVNPQQSLVGRLLGTGDLISFNQPSTVDVEVLYTGQLIFY